MRRWPSILLCRNDDRLIWTRNCLSGAKLWYTWTYTYVYVYVYVLRKYSWRWLWTMTRHIFFSLEALRVNFLVLSWPIIFPCPNWFGCTHIVYANTPDDDCELWHDYDSSLRMMNSKTILQMMRKLNKDSFSPVSSLHFDQYGNLLENESTDRRICLRLV